MLVNDPQQTEEVSHDRGGVRGRRRSPGGSGRRAAREALAGAGGATRAAPTVASGVARHPRLRAFLRGRRDSSTITGLALTVAVGLGAVAVAGVGVLLAMVRAGNGFASYDVAIARFAATHATSLSTDVLRLLSNLGGTAGAITLGLVVAAVEYRRHPTPAIPAFLLVVIGGQFALSNLIKVFVDRARPALDQLTGFASSSFPSGHATAAAATLAACGLLLGRGRSTTTRAVLAGVASGLAVAVAGTRVFLGVHWFTDVLAGLLVGWGWFAVCSIAFGGQLLRFGAPVAAAERIAELPATSFGERSAG